MENSIIFMYFYYFAPEVRSILLNVSKQSLYNEKLKIILTLNSEVIKVLNRKQ